MSAWKCVWFRGWGSARRWPTALRPCRWHNDEANCLCLHPDRGTPASQRRVEGYAPKLRIEPSGPEP